MNTAGTRLNILGIDWALEIRLSEIVWEGVGIVWSFRLMTSDVSSTGNNLIGWFRFGIWVVDAFVNLELWNFISRLSTRVDYRYSFIILNLLCFIFRTCRNWNHSFLKFICNLIHGFINFQKSNHKRLFLLYANFLFFPSSHLRLESTFDLIVKWNSIFQQRIKWSDRRSPRLILLGSYRQRHVGFLEA